MQKEIKDYLHLYLGCEVEYTLTGMTHQLIGLEGETAYIYGGTSGRHVVNVSNIKPILRPLSDMTEEEMNNTPMLDGDELPTVESMAAQISFLVSKGFDLFGLIDAGLAIDKSKLN